MNINDSIKSKAVITADKTQLEKPAAKPAQTTTCLLYTSRCV